MRIEISKMDAEMLRDLLKQKVLELDTEINRSDSLEFKEGLRQLDRRVERIVGQISAVLEQPSREGETPARDNERPRNDTSTPPSSSEEATEGFVTEIESRTRGVAPTEPDTFAREGEE
jgi:hypothetical protein